MYLGSRSELHTLVYQRQHLRMIEDVEKWKEELLFASTGIRHLHSQFMS